MDAFAIGGGAGAFFGIGLGVALKGIIEVNAFAFGPIAGVVFAGG